MNSSQELAFSSLGLVNSYWRPVPFLRNFNDVLTASPTTIKMGKSVIMYAEEGKER